MVNIFSGLPCEIFSDKIFTFLEITDILSLLLVDSHSNSIFKNNWVWEHFCFRKFGEDHIMKLVELFFPNEVRVNGMPVERDWKIITKSLLHASKIVKMKSPIYGKIYTLNIGLEESRNFFFEQFPYFSCQTVRERIKKLNYEEYCSYLSLIEQLESQEYETLVGTFVGYVSHYNCVRGKLTYHNGSTYEGEFSSDGNSQPKRNGFGVFINTQRGMKYEGEWESDIKQGKGKCTWFKSGDVFEGNYENGVWNGYGEYLWKESGSRYFGDYKMGKMHGKGTFVWVNGNKYVGSVEDDDQHGFGITYSSYCDVTKEYMDICYAEHKKFSSWKKGKFVHKGKLPFVVEGTWDMKEDIGGKKYNEFIGKLFDGKGNVVAKGLWINLKNETFVLTDNNKEIYNELINNKFALRKNLIE